MSLKALKSWQQEVTGSVSWVSAGFVAVLLLGLLLRFWQLDAKALWLDEVITALFSLGRTYADVPQDQWFSTEQLTQIFTLQPGVSDAEIVQRLVTDSTHPPLFFLLMYRWMKVLHPVGEDWVWALRSLPALFGVGAIAAMYALGRIAFNPTVAFLGAAVMAVSPFAVYLSQEARHYTLPMLLVILGLVGLVQVQQDLQRNYLRPWVWWGWVAVNVLGLYTHYFCGIAIVAQVAALLGWMVWQRREVSRFGWAALGLAIAGIILFYLPWLPNLLGHAVRPETTWMRVPHSGLGNYIAPLYQMLVGWVLMLVALPVEAQPAAIAIPMAVLMLGFGAWVGWHGWRGLRKFWQHTPEQRSVIALLGGFTLVVLLQFFGIVYLLDKDITVVPRYNFVYYPGVCALLAIAMAGLRDSHRDTRAAQPKSIQNRNSGPLPRFLQMPSRIPIIVLMVGLISSAVVVNDLAFHKSYYPSKIAQKMAFAPQRPLLLVANYHSPQEIALFLSIALELRKVYLSVSDPGLLYFVFLRPESHFEAQWGKLSQLALSTAPPANLWMLAPASISSKQFPPTLMLRSPQNTSTTCQNDPDNHYRLGFPYQLYRCLALPSTPVG